MSDSVTKYFENADTTIPTVPKDKIVKDRIVKDVIDRFRDRSELGLNKYGITLFDSPEGLYVFLQHLQDELMDATLYVEKLKNLTLK